MCLLLLRDVGRIDGIAARIAEREAGHFDAQGLESDNLSTDEGMANVWILIGEIRDFQWQSGIVKVTTYKPRLSLRTPRMI